MNARHSAALALALPLLLSGLPAAAAGTASPTAGRSCNSNAKEHLPRTNAEKTHITTGATAGMCSVKKFTFTVTLQQYRALGIWDNKASASDTVTDGGEAKATATWKCGKDSGTQTYRIVANFEVDGSPVAGGASAEKRLTCPQ